MKNNIRVGFQGAFGSNSHQAALSFMKDNAFEPVPLISSSGVVSALRSRDVDYGVVAVRNSTAGRVSETEEALKGLDYKILGELILPIHHYLYKRAGDETKIKRIISHPQALLQTKKYRKANYPDAIELPYQDTALAAMDLSCGKFEEGTAVIAPKMSGTLYSLFVVDSSIEDEKDNQTLFYLIRL